MTPGDNTRLLLPIHDEDHVQGPASAGLTLVEYGDYECPDCGRLFEIIRNLQTTLGERLRIVYRHYPLSGIHPQAQEAAEAAEAAGAQGRFWEMHDLLFQNQDALKPKDLLAYGERLSLDLNRFRGELKKGMYRELVREDFRRGVQNGVYGTPGLFLNGVRHNGAWDHDTLLQTLTQSQ
jgi:protein-disulfide isomerase